MLQCKPSCFTASSTISLSAFSVSLAYCNALPYCFTASRTISLSAFSVSLYIASLPFASAASSVVFYQLGAVGVNAPNRPRGLRQTPGPKGVFI